MIRGIDKNKIFIDMHHVKAVNSVCCTKNVHDLFLNIYTKVFLACTSTNIMYCLFYTFLFFIINSFWVIDELKMSLR